MSNVLHRIRAIQQAKENSAPTGINDQIASQYIADLEEKAYKKAQNELNSALIEAANQGEIEGLQKMIEAAKFEHEATKTLLTQAQAEIVELRETIKSLKQNMNIKPINLKPIEDQYNGLIGELKGTIKLLQEELVRERQRPPVVLDKRGPLPEIEFIAQRGMDGRIESVTGRPKYERPN